MLVDVSQAEDMGCWTDDSSRHLPHLLYDKTTAIAAGFQDYKGFSNKRCSGGCKVLGYGYAGTDFLSITTKV